MIRYWRLRRRGLGFAYWAATRHCPHPVGMRGEAIIDSGRRKMFWCNTCEWSEVA